MTIIHKKKTPGKLQLDLAGSAGNGFVLLGFADNFCKLAGFDAEKTEAVLEEMKSSDYRNLVETFDKYFGDHVDFINPPWDEEDVN